MKEKCPLCGDMIDVVEEFDMDNHKEFCKRGK